MPGLLPEVQAVIASVPECRQCPACLGPLVRLSLKWYACPFDDAVWKWNAETGDLDRQFTAGERERRIDWATEYREYVEEGERLIREHRPVRWSEREWAAEMIAAYHREHHDAPNPLPMRYPQRLAPMPRRPDGRCQTCPRPAQKPHGSRCWYCYKAARQRARRAA